MTKYALNPSGFIITVNESQTIKVAQVVEVSNEMRFPDNYIILVPIGALIEHNEIVMKMKTETIKIKALMNERENLIAELKEEVKNLKIQVINK